MARACSLGLFFVGMPATERTVTLMISSPRASHSTPPPTSYSLEATSSASTLPSPAIDLSLPYS